MIITEYVVGFMFDPSGEQVALIRKNKPPWQAGKLNGIGGKVENETNGEAMVREFMEEAGAITQEANWQRFALLRGREFLVEFYVSTGKGGPTDVIDDWSNAPGYPNDLNAIHAAVKTLPETKRGYFNAELFKIATGRNLSSAIKEPEFIFAALTASAAQRAEAFLRTLGKWKDTP